MDSLSLPENIEFHHIGYATTSIEKELPHFKALGYVPEGESFSDPKQGIRGCFLTCGAGPRIELLENLPQSETLTPWLNSGVKMYHLAYKIGSLDQALSWSSSLRARVVVPPVESVAFYGKKICFVMLRNGFMVEFIER